MIKIIMPDGSIRQTKTRKVKSIIWELGLNENAVLVAKDDVLLTPDIQVPDEAEIKIISVVSGG